MTRGLLLVVVEQFMILIPEVWSLRDSGPFVLKLTQELGATAAPSLA